MEMLLKRSLIHLPQCLLFTVIALPWLDTYTVWQVIKVLEQDLTRLRDLSPFPGDCNIQRGQNHKPYFKIREQVFSTKKKKGGRGDMSFQMVGVGAGNNTSQVQVHCLTVMLGMSTNSSPTL
jgi:hypothetical protein